MMFKTYKQLSQEVDKRDYQNIEGLKAHISKKDYYYFLEVLPPMFWHRENFLSYFYLKEFLSGDLTYKFYKIQIKKDKYVYACEVVDFIKDTKDKLTKAQQWEVRSF